MLYVRECMYKEACASRRVGSLLKSPTFLLSILFWVREFWIRDLLWVSHGYKSARNLCSPGHCGPADTGNF